VPKLVICSVTYTGISLCLTLSPCHSSPLGDIFQPFWRVANSASSENASWAPHVLQIVVKEDHVLERMKGSVVQCNGTNGLKFMYKW